MKNGRIKKTAILMMAVFLMFLSTAGTILANDVKMQDIDSPDEKDFSSCRLLVTAEDASVFPGDAPILSSYNETYLLQFEDPESTKEAYVYYQERVEMVDVDTAIFICDGEEIVPEEERMTEEQNPLAQLEEAVTEKKSAGYDIALIDTGAEDRHVRDAISMIGDDPSDHHGHGTNMARFIAEENDQVSILSIKAIGDDGRGDVSAVYAAIEYAITQNVSIISLSASAETADSQILTEVINRAVEQGIVFVGSAGNLGKDASCYIPGCIEAATIIGACDKAGKRIPSSNYGPTVDYYVAAGSTSEAAARFSGFLSAVGREMIAAAVNQGFLFTESEMQTEESIESLGYWYFAGSGAVSPGTFRTDYSQQFYSVEGVGDNDVIFCTYVDGSWQPAYCIDHGKVNPSGDYYQYTQATSNMLGYIMRHGYPNTNWGLSWQEAQFLTQAAVFGACGVPFFEIADGLHSPYWIWDHIWGDGWYTEGDYIGNYGHFQNAIDLLNNARRNASASDGAYVNYWTPSSGILQRMITPARNVTSVMIKKTSSATETVSHQLDGNAMYAANFSGTQFSVKTYDAYLGTWSAAKNYETGNDGTFTIGGLHVGDKVRVEEIQAPKGYMLPSQPVQEITLASSGNSITFRDEPVFDQKIPVVKKVEYRGQGLISDAPLAGAIFRMQYFDNDSCSGDAKRTWYFLTGEDGTFSYSEVDLSQEFENSALFVDSQNFPRLPLGSILLTEIRSPQGFLNSSQSLKAKITQPNAGGEAVFSWITQSGGTIEVHNDQTAVVGNTGVTLAVKKIDASTRKNLANAKLQILDGETVLASWTTGETEKIFQGLFAPGKTYLLRETKAPEHYVKADDISFRFDAQGNLEVLSANAEQYISSDGIPGIVMKDDKMIALPMTGSAGFPLSLIAGCLLLLGSAAGLIVRKKKFLSIMFCLLSITLLSVPTFAAGSLNIDSGDDPDHQYTAYQLLSGTALNEEILWDIHIAEDIPSSLWDMLQVDPAKRSSVEIAEWMAEHIRMDADGSFAIRVARAVLQESSIQPEATFTSDEAVSFPDGYYLIVSDDAQPMLLLIGKDKTLTIHEKSSVPTMYKEIGEVDAKGQVFFGKVADSGIGKKVPYRIYGTLPLNYNAYDQYYYCFHDQYETGLSIDLSSVSVKVLDPEGNVKEDITAGASIGLKDQLLTVEFPNLKEVYPLYSDREVLLVEYDAFLTEEATIGADSNDNDAWIEYTRSPTCEKHGTSVPDRCQLYTWQLQLIKTGAESGNLLAGAAFSVRDENGMYLNQDGTLSAKKTEQSLWTTNKNGLLKVKYLDSGSYLLTEEQAPNGYYPVPPFTIEIHPDYEEDTQIAALSATGKEIQSVDVKTGFIKVKVSDRPIPPAPKTGDMSWTVFYLMLLIGSIFLFAAVLTAKKIRKGNKK